jgi:hypothetical protein
MPKTDLRLEKGDYAPVADRIALFYAKHPTGRIRTTLIERTDEVVVFKASIFRAADDILAAATGWASERVGDGDVNAVACLENTETSAIGRALANLGFTASSRRPSAEEMEKADRERARLAAKVAEPSIRDRLHPPGPPPPLVKPGGRAEDPALQSRADAVHDVLVLLDAAARYGLRPRRTESLRHRLLTPDSTPDVGERVGRLLRHWIARRIAERASRPGIPRDVTTPHQYQ